MSTFAKGSKAAKDFMAKLRAARKGAKKKVKTVKKTVKTKIKKHKAKAKRIKKAIFSGEKHTDIKSHNYRINISGLFHTDTINDIDSLKKQYRELALKYHPDAGGTHSQFIELKNEYDQLFKKILNNSDLNQEQKDNEIKLDEALQNVVDCLIMLPNVNIEIIGKWIWVRGDTYPIKTELKAAGLIFIKKAGQPYWVYRGVESAGRGKMSIQEIKSKYGTHTMTKPNKKSLSGLVPKINKSKLKTNLLKITKALNKRPL